jgi:hypothetical protein
MLDIANNETLAEDLRRKGMEQAQHFDAVKHANNIMEVL